MIFDQKRLYELLPAIYRIRDAEQHGPLRELLQVIGEQIAVLEESLDQLYDDQFVETAAPWVLPYLGGLVGARGLAGRAVPGMSPRAEVAHVIGNRRRKGTAAMIEQLAHDVTGWPAHAVEFFELIAATQFMNHRRERNQSFVAVRGAERLEELGGAFERAVRIGDADLTHTVDVRRIARGHGRYNIPNIGIFLWRLRAMPLTRSPIVPAFPGDQHKFVFNPLGAGLPLFHPGVSETSAAHLAEPINVPDRLRRRPFARAVKDFYGSGKSLVLEKAPDPTKEPLPILSSEISVCDLSDWKNLPSSGISIDPLLGRIAFADKQDHPVLATFHHGFSDNLGGGEYGRPQIAPPEGLRLFRVANTFVKIAPDEPPPYKSIPDALTDLDPNGGVIEILTSGRFEEPFSIDATGKFVAIRAADKRRPTVVLGGDLKISGGSEDEVVLDGLLLAGGAVSVNGLRRLRLRHCTLVPDPARPSLTVASANTRIEIERCILGGIRANAEAEVRIESSIVDAGSETAAAYAGPVFYGPPLHVVNSTVIGVVRTTIMRLASNSIFLAAAPDAPVVAERRQEGCVRFSYVSHGARLPARFHCQPATEDSLIRPQLLSTRFGDPAYCQLSAACPPEIREGADDEGSMGAFHDIHEPQREARLRASIEEYLRFGLQAGIFYAT
ncbi:MAG TPA: hypothetical protein VI670_25010 [Thermoanaerobaculia bacterium]